MEIHTNFLAAWIWISLIDQHSYYAPPQYQDILELATTDLCPAHYSHSEELKGIQK